MSAARRLWIAALLSLPAGALAATFEKTWEVPPLITDAKVALLLLVLFTAVALLLVALFLYNIRPLEFPVSALLAACVAFPIARLFMPGYWGHAVAVALLLLAPFQRYTASTVFPFLIIPFLLAVANEALLYGFVQLAYRLGMGMFVAHYYVR